MSCKNYRSMFVSCDNTMLEGGMNTTISSAAHAHEPRSTQAFIHLWQSQHYQLQPIQTALNMCSWLMRRWQCSDAMQLLDCAPGGLHVSCLALPYKSSAACILILS